MAADAQDRVGAENGHGYADVRFSAALAGEAAQQWLAKSGALCRRILRSLALAADGATFRARVRSATYREKKRNQARDRFPTFTLALDHQRLIVGYGMKKAVST
jgi:hypothetical protein